MELFRENTVEPLYSGQIFQELAKSRSNSHSKPSMQRTLVIADTTFRNHVIIYFKIYLYSGHTNFWVNQETIIKQVRYFKKIQQIKQISQVISCIFFLSGFSFTDTVDSQDSSGRTGPSFIPLYHFRPLTNIQAFICNFACEMTITYF